MRLPRIILFIVGYPRRKAPPATAKETRPSSGLVASFLRQARVSPWLFLVMAAIIGATSWWLLSTSSPPSATNTSAYPSVGFWPRLPGASGTLELLLWDYIVPLGTAPGTYQLIIQEAISHFESTHPGVKVKYELFHWSEGDKKLAEALAAGGSVPIPDVYLSAGDVAIYDQDRQVPVERYLGREKTDYEKASLDAWTRDEHIWGWPRWTSVRAWAANLALSPGASQLREQWTQSGWTWTDLRAAAGEAVKLGDSRAIAGIALPRSTTAATALADLAAAAGIDGPWDASGRYAWNRPEFTRVVEFIADLGKQGLARMDGDRFGESALQLFWDGRAAFVPNGGTWLHDRQERGTKIPAPQIPATPEVLVPPQAPNQAEARDAGAARKAGLAAVESVPAATVPGASDIRLALLPVPHPDGTGRSIVPTRTSAYVVFTTGPADAKKRDFRRIRAAMDLARLLSRYRIHWLSYNLRLWPAYKADLESLGPRARILSALMPLAAPGKAMTVREYERERKFLAEVVTPALSRLWRKDLTVSNFVAQLAEEAAKY